MNTNVPRPFESSSRPEGRAGWIWPLVVVTGALVLTGAWLRRSNDDDSHEIARSVAVAAEPSVEIDLDLDLPRAVNPGYVGPQACAECHPQRVKTFTQTGHFKTCRIPDEATMPDGFGPGQGTFVTRYPGLRFLMEQTDGEFTQTAVQLTDEGERRTTTRIDLVYGAGTADEIYLAWHDDDRMYELPMAWLSTHGEWAAEHFDPYGSGDFSRPLTLRCLECHTTWFEYVPGSVNQYRRENFICGVTCERCHGPGAEHVAYHQQHPDETQGEAIVNPDQLSRERQIEVCTQCHSNALKHLGPALSYVPGERLADHYKTLISRSSDEDHVANQIQYLRQSACFEQSGSMTCTTCHNSHEPRSPSNTGAVYCMTCHAHADCKEQTQLPSELQDRCVDCHMPARLKINVNFQTEEDLFVAVLRRHEHRVAVDPLARDEVLREWHLKQSNDEDARLLTRRLVDHWLAEADSRRTEHRYFAAISSLREALELADDPEIRRQLDDVIAIQSGIYADWDLAVKQVTEGEHDAAITTLERLLKAQPQYAVARGKLGTLYAAKGQRDRARELLAQAADDDPNDPYGHAMLGWLAYLDGRFAEAMTHYAQAQSVEPYNAKLTYQTGLALQALGHSGDALKAFHTAWQLDPGNAVHNQALCLELIESGRDESAIELAHRNSYLPVSERVQLLMTLATACAKVHHSDFATKATAVARELGGAPRSHSIP